MPIQPLVLPPRPPELPTAPPPASTDKPNFLRNDAIVSNWIDDIERSLKDQWLKLAQQIEIIEGRITVLEKRIADTYVFGQKDVIEVDPDPEAHNWLGLPLRVVRPENLMELVATAETASTDGDVHLQVLKNGVQIAMLTLAPGETITHQAMGAPDAGLQMLKDDKLTVVIVDAGTDTADVVVQARCR